MRLPITENTRFISHTEEQLAMWLVKQLFDRNPNPFDNIVYKEGNKNRGFIVFKVKGYRYDRTYTLTYGGIYKLTSYDETLFIVSRKMLVCLYYNDVELTNDTIIQLFINSSRSEDSQNYNVIAKYNNLHIIETPMSEAVRKVYPNMGKYNVYSDSYCIIITPLSAHPRTELYITHKLLKKLTDG
jgi:hypothetical protein